VNTKYGWHQHIGTVALDLSPDTIAAREVLPLCAAGIIVECFDLEVTRAMSQSTAGAAHEHRLCCQKKGGKDYRVVSVSQEIRDIDGAAGTAYQVPSIRCQKLQFPPVMPANISWVSFGVVSSRRLIQACLDCLLGAGEQAIH
jgi:hypothetical protein